MGRPLIDITGKIFGELTVISRGLSTNNNTYWLCKCSCGKEKEIARTNLRSGDIRSCGCKTSEFLSKALRGKYIIHGQACNNKPSPEWRAWFGAFSRCYNKYNPSYKRYGGRGIKVCSRWKESFQNFFDDMGPKPSPKHSLDRVNNNGDYSPDNCRWSSAKEQQNNRSNNRLISFNGKTKTLTAWAEEVGVRRDTLWRRIVVQEWSIERALTTATIPPKLRRTKQRDNLPKLPISTAQW